MTMAWSKGHCAVGMSTGQSRLSLTTMCGNCSTCAGSGLKATSCVRRPTLCARPASQPSFGTVRCQATMKSFNEMSSTPALRTCVWKSVLDLATVCASSSAASGAMMPSRSSVALNSDAFEVLLSIPTTKASTSGAISARTFASAGRNVDVTSLPHLPCTAQTMTGTHSPAGQTPHRPMFCHRSGMTRFELSVRRRCSEARTTTVRARVVAQSFAFFLQGIASPIAASAARQPRTHFAETSAPSPANKSRLKSKAVSSVWWTIAYLSSNVENKLSPNCDLSRRPDAIMTKS
mmetsp:Transcript_12580/g.42032  ORF Transcript_12580/g.42032 Transcript_12580/m.42032 type:complete len:291 (-) Transcript_12580:1930-2802(-)